MTFPPNAFLVVIDGTPECGRALRFASLRALRTGASLKLLHVIKPTGFLQWGGVQRTMDEEVEAEARRMLEEKAALVHQLLGTMPEVALRRGNPAEEVRRFIEEDGNVRSLVLAAATTGRPGPLIDLFAGEQAAGLRCLVMIVPGGISDEELDRLT